MKWLVIIGLLLLATEAFSDRMIQQTLIPATNTVIAITNPTTQDIRVRIRVKIYGNERINNAPVASNFGVCVFNGSGCATYVIMSGETMTCNAAYTQCDQADAAGTLIPAGGIIRFGIGSKLDPVMCYFGCSAAALLGPATSAGGSIATITVVGNTGHVMGLISSFDDLFNTTTVQQLNGGRAF